MLQGSGKKVMVTKWKGRNRYKRKTLAIVEPHTK